MQRQHWSSASIVRQFAHGQMGTYRTLEREMSAHLRCRFLNQHVNRESRMQVCCEESAACSATEFERTSRLISFPQG